MCLGKQLLDKYDNVTDFYSLIFTDLFGELSYQQKQKPS